MKTAYRSQHRENTACYSPSTSSLSSSLSSTSSSIQSLNSVPQQAPRLPDAKSNKDVIRSLQQSLDQVLRQKNDVLKRLDSLGGREASLKSKLSQKDLIYSIKFRRRLKSYQELLKNPEIPENSIEFKKTNN